MRRPLKFVTGVRCPPSHKEPSRETNLHSKLGINLIWARRTTYRTERCFQDMPHSEIDYFSPTADRIVPRRRLISICVPVFNEEANILILIGRLRDVVRPLENRFDFEFLFTDDCSTDGSYGLLAHEAKNDHRIRVLRLSRNFGFQRNVLTSFLNSRGDAAVEIDADLQDPPELIGEFLALWEKGYKVVYGVRAQRYEGRIITGLRTLAYRVIQRLSEIPVPLNAGDFRLVDRVIIEHLREQTDRDPYLRGAITALGYPQIGVPYKRLPRHDGYSKFPIHKLIKLGIDGVTSQSIRPLHYITALGMIFGAMTAALSIVYFASWLFGIGVESRGFTTLVLLQLFAITMNAFFLGVLGEYVGRIFNNVRGHAIAVVERRIENGVESPHCETVSRATEKSAKADPPPTS
jgi:polyisoprenyl-phosphate glycosyltransferase